MKQHWHTEGERGGHCRPSFCQHFWVNQLSPSNNTATSLDPVHTTRSPGESEGLEQLSYLIIVVQMDSFDIKVIS